LEFYLLSAGVKKEKYEKLCENWKQEGQAGLSDALKFSVQKICGNFQSEKKWAPKGPIKSGELLYPQKLVKPFAEIGANLTKICNMIESISEDKNANRNRNPGKPGCSVNANPLALDCQGAVRPEGHHSSPGLFINNIPTFLRM
jgi:hypothetical protein